MKTIVISLTAAIYYTVSVIIIKQKILDWVRKTERSLLLPPGLVISFIFV